MPWSESSMAQIGVVLFGVVLFAPAGRLCTARLVDDETPPAAI